MPMTRCKLKSKRGWKWGQSGKCYPDKSEALRQMRAIRASGWAENVYCATGPGGGKDPTCSPGNSGSLGPGSITMLGAAHDPEYQPLSDKQLRDRLESVLTYSEGFSKKSSVLKSDGRKASVRLKQASYRDEDESTILVDRQGRVYRGPKFVLDNSPPKQVSPENLPALKERLGQVIEKENQAMFKGRHQFDRPAEQLARDMVREGVKVSIHHPDDSNSRYVYADLPSGGQFKIRFATHSQPMEAAESGWKTVGGFDTSTGKRHSGSDVSIDPESGKSVADAFLGFKRALASGIAGKVHNVKVNGNGKPEPNPLRADPTRMGLIRRRFDADVKRRFGALLAEVKKLIVEQDSFGLKEPKTFNAFCPTGEGGGIDPSCGKGGETREIPDGGLKPAKSPRFHRGSQGEAMTAAVRMSAHYRKPVYLYPTSQGFQVTSIKPSLPSQTRGYEVSATHSGSSYSVIRKPLTQNAFCPTGEGGGVDPTCSGKKPQRDDAKGRGTYKIFYRASYDKPDSKPRSIVVKSPSAYLAMRGFSKRYGNVNLLDMKIVNSAGPVDNVYCATGPGGGKDPTCPPGSGGSSGASNPKIEAWAAAKFGSAEKGKAFAKWFGDSKVVDENGEPLVVYHGTTDSFDEFNPLSHFGSTEAAEDRIRRGGSGDFLQDAQVKAVYLAIRNPLEIKDTGKQHSSDDLLRAIRLTGALSEEDINRIVSTPGKMGAWKDTFFGIMKEKGIDGLTYVNQGEGKGSRAWVTLSASQVKSSIGNRGTFDPDDPNISNTAGLTANAPYRFRFATSVEQITQFQAWLSQRMYYHILGTSLEQIERAWWTQYVEEGYRKGAGRAFDDVKKPLHQPDTWSERLPWYDGTRREFLQSSFGRAVRVEKVKLLAGRVFTELRGVTEEMNTKLSRDLTDGLVQGKSAWDIYKKVADDVGISEKRAMLISRTELTRVHAEGALDAMGELGVEDVSVMAEWLTAGDLRVCPACQSMEGVILKLDEMRGMIPRHPGCRCTPIPANVGESRTSTKVDWQKTPIERTTTQKGIEGAIKESLKAEGRGDKTTWPGADAEISKVRPKSITNVFCPTGEGGGIDPSCDAKGDTRSLPELSPGKSYGDKISSSDVVKGDIVHLRSDRHVSYAGVSGGTIVSKGRVNVTVRVETDDPYTIKMYGPHTDYKVPRSAIQFVARGDIVHPVTGGAQ